MKAPGGRTDEGYYSTIAIADHAIQCLKLHEQQHGSTPFFQYVAFYSPHYPLHALRDDIAAYRGHFSAGWDACRQGRWERMKAMGILDCALSQREERIVPSWNLKSKQLEKRIGPGEVSHAVGWDTLTDAQQSFQATKMAIHAAMITRMDAEIGRLIEQLKDMGAYENTLILFMSDNGASAEQIIRGDGHDPSVPLGSAKSYVCLGPGWATAANTPFRLHKHWNHEGGISSPLIAHWPRGIPARGELRHSPTHFIDIAPTILAVAGGSWPTAAGGEPAPPRPGLSLLPEFAQSGAVPHESLWWCHGGHRALRMGKWKLVHRQPGPEWELYDLSIDRSETHDVASQHADRVQRMAEKWQATLDGFVKDLADTRN